MADQRQLLSEVAGPEVHDDHVGLAPGVETRRAFHVLGYRIPRAVARVSLRVALTQGIQHVAFRGHSGTSKKLPSDE